MAAVEAKDMGRSGVCVEVTWREEAAGDGGNAVAGRDTSHSLA